MAKREIESIVERILAEVVPGFVAQPLHLGPQPSGCDLVARVGDRQIMVAVKAVSLSVVEDVLARLSMGALEVGRMAEGQNAVPMVAVMVPALGRKVVHAAVDFMARHMPHVGWAVLDRAGNARVAVPKLGIDLDRRIARVASMKPGRSSVRLFSDLNRWLLKVLLLKDAPVGLWGGPRQPILSGHDLGQVASVSAEMVRRFMNAFEKRDFLRQTAKGLHIVRRSALLDLWRGDDALDVHPGMPVRRVMGAPGSLAELSEMAGFSDSVVVAGFEACRLLGVLHTMVSMPVEVHAIAPVAQILERFELEQCASPNAEFWLLPSSHLKSIQRGSVQREGLQVVDAFQAAFDVLRHPARGHEQSDYVLREVLGLEGVD